MGGIEGLGTCSESHGTGSESLVQSKPQLMIGDKHSNTTSQLKLSPTPIRAPVCIQMHTEISVYTSVKRFRLVSWATILSGLLKKLVSLTVFCIQGAEHS